MAAGVEGVAADDKAAGDEVTFTGEVVTRVAGVGDVAASVDAGVLKEVELVAGASGSAGDDLGEPAGGAGAGGVGTEEGAGAAGVAVDTACVTAPAKVAATVGEARVGARGDEEAARAGEGEAEAKDIEGTAGVADAAGEAVVAGVAFEAGVADVAGAAGGTCGGGGSVSATVAKTASSRDMLISPPPEHKIVETQTFLDLHLLKLKSLQNLLNYCRYLFTDTHAELLSKADKLRLNSQYLNEGELLESLAATGPRLQLLYDPGPVTFDAASRLCTRQAYIVCSQS